MSDPSSPSDERVDELLDAATEQALSDALRAAWAPSELDPGRNERFIEQALEDPLAPPSAEELVESERLRQALEGHGEHPHARLAEALRVAIRPKSIGEPSSQFLARNAIGTKRSASVIFVAFGAAATVALAAAAAAMLFVRPAERAEPAAPAAAARISVELVPSRSTAPLFEAKFDTRDTSARLDRIASARERDLRSNRYALWGVP